MFVCMYTINEIEEDNKEYQAHNRIKRKHVYTHIYRQAAKIKTHTHYTQTSKYATTKQKNTLKKKWNNGLKRNGW